MVKREYVQNLENVIKQMLIPLKGVPFNLVIETLSGHKVIPFDSANQEDKELLQLLKKATIETGKEINKNGIQSRRANEVGNYIEDFVRNGLNKVGLRSETPRGKSGRRKAMGYPDLLFYFRNKPYYLECKTYNKENIATTQRSFYFSPSRDFKVTHDTHHLMVSYEIGVEGRSGTKNIYKCRHWKIISIENLLVDVKNEFNSNNRRLYSSEGGTKLLAEGDICDYE